MVTKVLFSGGPLDGLSVPLPEPIPASSCKRVSMVLYCSAKTFVEATYTLERETEGLAVCQFAKKETHERRDGRVF